MPNLSINDLIEMQNILQHKMKGKWMPTTPENGHLKLLWMFEEMGEVVAIIKKRGSDAIMEDKNVRTAFVEELADVLMYFTNTMTCFGVSAEELSEAFIAKHAKNMRRDFVTEHQNYRNGDPR